MADLMRVLAARAESERSFDRVRSMRRFDGGRPTQIDLTQRFPYYRKAVDETVQSGEA